MTSETSVIIPNHRSQTTEDCQLVTLIVIKMLLFHIGRLVVMMIYDDNDNDDDNNNNNNNNNKRLYTIYICRNSFSLQTF